MLPQSSDTFTKSSEYAKQKHPGCKLALPTSELPGSLALPTSELLYVTKNDGSVLEVLVCPAEGSEKLVKTCIHMPSHVDLCRGDQVTDVTADRQTDIISALYSRNGQE